MIRFATMKYTITRGHHRREWNDVRGRWDRRWVIRETVSKDRGIRHIFIHDEGTRWKSPCGQGKHDHLGGSFGWSEEIVLPKDVQTKIDVFLGEGALRRCMKCVEWVRKNRDVLIAGELMGEKA